MSREEPSVLAPARGLSPLGITISVGVLAFLCGIAALGLIVRMNGGTLWSDSVEEVAEQSVQPPTEAQPIVPDLPPGTDLATLNAREQALATRLDVIEGRLSAVDSDSRVAGAYAARAEGLMIAFATRRLLDRGLPLGAVDEQLRARFGDTHPDAVATIVRAAEDPVTLEDLRLALDAIGPRLAAGAPGEGPWSRIRRLADDLVVLRQETSPGPRPADRLTRARRMLDAGQVEAALAEVSHMPGIDYAENWVNAAKRYIAARRALGEIELAAMQGPGAPTATARAETTQ
ncbi:hypothetical protein [Stakelama tenebrarum]|uniref:Uncharacterized protein n=1 Tax=Stakelama tenebrarum TaxID=2711215 RepID=A0A6G6Y114_9SPHN|nr:hypothetical protein [Sphingosinithalassobacter tenebrarum]QIG78634.1 hypothetical protein G5C33_01755 [Sphingosinithalassobacter tenebrarum]